MSGLEIIRIVYYEEIGAVIHMYFAAYFLQIIWGEPFKDLAHFICQVAEPVLPEYQIGLNSLTFPRLS